MQENNTNTAMPKKKKWLLPPSLLSFIILLVGAVFWGYTLNLGIPLPVFGILFGIIVIFFLVLAFNERKLWNNAWRNLADELGFKFLAEEDRKDPNNPQKDISIPEMKGGYQGYPIHISGLSIRRRNSARKYTHVEVTLRTGKSELLIMTNQRHPNLPTMKIGDTKFDREFYVQSVNSEFARAVLATPEQRQRILDVKASKLAITEISIGGDRLLFRDTGLILNSAYMRAVLDRLVAFARDIDQEVERLSVSKQ